MSELKEHRLKRLNMRAARRGTKEMDLILGAYAEQYLPEMSDTDLDLFEALLNESDHDLYRWVTGQGTPPVQLSDLMSKIIKFSGLT